MQRVLGNILYKYCFFVTASLPKPFDVVTSNSVGALVT